MGCSSYAITWANVDSSSIRSSNIHLRYIFRWDTQPSIIKISLKITYQKFNSILAEANELTPSYAEFS